MKRVVIVGGGYAGVAVARALDAVAEVRLVEPRDRFAHNVAAIRAVVDPALLERLIIPYDRLLRRGTVIHGLASSITDGRVGLADGTTVEADVVVAATGSSYARPFKPRSARTDAFAEESRAVHAALADARMIAIVGGGPVGVELAGEIASATPGKTISLFTASAGLLPGFPAKLSAALVRQLEALGVRLRLGARVERLQRADEPYAGGFVADGTDVEADLVFPVLGARPVPPPLAGAELGLSGRMKVDPWLRPAGRKAVFALGDAAETGDPMTIVSILRQAPWLTKILKAVLEGRAVETLAPYKLAPSPAILVPLGPKAGASLLPVTRAGLIVGPGITARFKGRDLFIPRYREMFGYGKR